MDQFCSENGFCGWFETSAKKNVGIQDAIKFIIQQISPNKLIETTDESENEFIDLGQLNQVQIQKGCCGSRNANIN